MSYVDHLVETPSNKKFVPQSKPIPGREAEMMRNTDGGAFVFRTSVFTAFNRFLIIGAAGGTFYASERKAVKDNADVIKRALAEDGVRAVNEIVTVSIEGRATKNDPAIFALALACCDENDETRKAAYAAIPQVLRIGTHLFTFMDTVKKLRKSSSGLRKAIKRYYDAKTTDQLAYDLLKYKQRNGWSHLDVMRLVRYNGANTLKAGSYRPYDKKSKTFELKYLTPKEMMARQNVIKYAFKGDSLDNKHSTDLPKIVVGDIAMKVVDKDIDLAVGIIQEFDLPRELVPTELLNDKRIWAALLLNSNYTALMRNLNKMTKLGLFDNFSPERELTVAKLTDEAALEAAKEHPFNILLAKITYDRGMGDKGALTWKPDPRISAALEDAFYKSFKYAEPLGINIYIGLDVSASMMGLSGSQNAFGLTPHQASAAMVAYFVRAEQNVIVRSYNSSIRPVLVNKNQSLAEVMRLANENIGSSTNCSLPVMDAIKNGYNIDLFLNLTDNETNSRNSGGVSGYMAEYRKRFNANAKMVVVGMSATECSIADPKDPGMMDVAGFDSALPKIISEFVRGF